MNVITQNVADEIAAYLAVFPDESTRLTALQSHIEDHAGDIMSRSTMRGHITGSMLVVNADKTQVLLIHHKLFNSWLQPGGHVDQGESPWVAAYREVGEETGLKAVERYVPKGFDQVPLDIDIHFIGANPKKNEGEHFHYDFLYLAVADDHAGLDPELSEVNGVQWAPIEILEGLMPTRFQKVSDKLRAIKAAELSDQEDMSVAGLS